MKNRIIVSLLLILSFFNSWSQRSKDGVGNITAANTIVNLYTPLTASVNAGVSTISVGSTAGFAIGDLIMIIQMQGASVRANKAWFIDTSMALPADTSMGYILNYNNAGNHEFAQINAVLSATSFSLDCGLLKNYTNTGKVQVIRVPRYSTLSVSGAGNITCPPWNGSTGGVAVVEVEFNATLSSVPSFNVNNKGFRGGGVENASTVSGANKFGSVKGAEGGYKGESIAGDTNTYKQWSVVFCRGAIANGGGGGTAHNAGGGGGANGGNPAAYNGYGNPTAGYATAWNLESAGFSGNVSSGGGRGGYSFSSTNQNPNSFGPGSGGWSGDGRRNMGGFGGRPLDYSTGKLFIGGGGGTGDSNDNYGAAAGNGGGMVYMLCYGNVSGAGTILADGGNGNNTIITGGCSGRDGASGGGGGGTIVLNIVGTTNLTAAPALFARGGGGGNQNFGAPCFNTEAYGPGAGGGGGYITYTGTLPLNAVNGGTNGIVSGNSGLIRTNFPPNGATMGGAGSSGAMTAARTITATPTTTICVNNSATLFAGTNASPATINWYSTIAGGSPIGTGSPYTTSVITVPGTYTLYAGYCQGGTYRVPSVITVITGPTLTVNSASICSGQTATLSVGGATTYTWSTGAFTSSITVNPVATTVYTVSGTIATCTAAITTTVSMLSAPVLAAPQVNICNGQAATLTAAGATSYTWSTGGTGASITVTPAVNTTYTVIGSNGACTSSITTNVTVNAAPVVTTNTVTICAGQSATLTGAGATNYTWSTGPTTTSITVSPASSTNYTVTGSNGTCTNSAIASVNVVPNLTVTATSATICQGATATLTASGAASYTWSTAQTTSSISVSPSGTTIYTVNGGSGTCNGTATATVVVNANPTLTVNSATVCSGQAATLTALGATAYTWNPGGLTGASVSVSPSLTQIYTVTGSNPSGCSGIITSTVTVNSTPTISATSATVCAGQTATLVASGATAYTWTPTGTVGATLVNTPAATTSFTVLGVNGSCSAQATATITLGTAVSISINQPTICIGETVTLTATSPATTYTWSTGANTSSIAVSPTVTTGYSVTGTSGGCSASGSTTVFVSGSPTVSVLSATICSGQTATLNALGATNYTWMPGSVVGPSLTASPVSTTNYTIIGATGSCTSLTTATITIGAAVSISINQPTICSGESTTLTATSPATTYTWSNGALTSSIAVTPTATTVYTVNGTSGSCNATGTTTVTVNNAPVLSVSGSTALCSGQTETLTATGADTYTWNPGNFTNASVVISPTVNTTYSVTGMSLSGCVGNTTIAVSVSAAGTISVTAPSTVICAGETASLTASGVGTFTWIPGGIVSSTMNVSPVSTQNYTVLSAVGTCTASSVVTISVTAPSSVSITPSSAPLVCNSSSVTLMGSGATSYTWFPGSIVANSIVVSPSVNTTYTLTGGAGVCISSAVQQVSVTSGINFTVNPTNMVLCSGTRTTLTAGGAQNYVWLPGNYTGSTVAINPSASTIYTVIGSVGSCLATKTISVRISSVTADFLILNNENDNFNSIQFQNISSGNNINHWYFSNGTDTYASDPSVYFGDPGTYVACLYVKNYQGCSDTLCKAVTVGCADNVVFIPNTFSPNEDGLNDVFKVVSLPQCIVKFSMHIFNSWGQKVFSSTKFDEGWDGTFKGQPADDNVYSYIIEYTMDSGKAYRRAGHVMLFK